MKQFFWIIALLAMCLPTQAQNRSIGKPVVAISERRMALVMGVSEYSNVQRLVNPANDADDITATLKDLGFTVTLLKNKNLGQIQAAINSFVGSLRENDVVFFYFSGHGIGYQDDNYLLPTDARVECLEQIAAYSISAKRLMADFQLKKVRNSFVFLDACRSMEQLDVCQSNQKGALKPQGFVIPQNQPTGNIVVYATQAGKTADDNSNNRNGLFTQELLKNLRIADLTLGEIITNTAEGVLEASLKMGRPRQEPTSYGELGRKFKFLKTELTPDPDEDAKRKEQESKDKEIADLKRQLAEATKVPIPTTKKFMDLPFADMVYVEGGTFEMGDVFGEGESNEKPVHSVTVGGFYMGKYEVTQRQWVEIMGDNPSGFKNCDNCPVEYVSWDDVQKFLTKLNAKEGRTASNGYRLPTEAEWEYAAREKGKKVRFGNGKDLLDPSEANFNANASFKQPYSLAGEYRLKTVMVNSFQPNDLGLYDMTGNVWEWCADWYASDWYAQAGAAAHNPQNYGSKSRRVLRGGSWGSHPQRSRVADRNHYRPSNRDNNFGFRLVSPQ